MKRYDVAVVGAGPAGSVTAALLARAGLDVALIDSARFPRYKVCGCCLSAGTLEHFGRLRLDVDEVLTQGARLRDVRIRAGRSVAALPLTDSLALERRGLDAALLHAAASHGVDVREGQRVTALEPTPDEVRVRMGGGGGEGEMRASIVVDAAGLGGVRTSGRSDTSVVAPTSRVGIGAVFDAAPAAYGPGSIHMTIGRDGYVGVVRFADGRVNVAAALSPVALRASGSPGDVVNRVLLESRLPPLADEPPDGWTGTRRLTRRPPRVAETRVFRVGDAAGYVEPFTGEGIAWALAGAEALAPLAAAAAERWSERHAASWIRTHARLTARGQRACRALAWGLRRPRLARMAVDALGLAPSLGRPVVRRIERAHATPLPR